METIPKSKMTQKMKLATSIVIWFCTFSLGLGVGFLPASLLELSKKFETDIPTISKAFSVISISFLFGAIICGAGFNYVNRQISSGILLILMGIGIILLPLVPSLLIFFIVAVIIGFGAAGYDTAQIVWILEIYKHKAAPYVQIQHACYALGAFISPLLMKNFLPEESKDQIENFHNLQTNQSVEESNRNNNTLIYSTNENDPKSSKLYIPFLIGGIVSIIGGFLIILLYFIHKYEKPEKIITPQNSDVAHEESKSYKIRRVVLIILSALVLGCYMGCELTSFQFLPTFTYFIDLHLSQRDGALILSGLAAAFTIGRILGIFLVIKVLPEILLVGNLILIAIGNTLLLIFANSSITILWVASLTLGLGFSTVFPSFYGYIEKHLKITNMVGAIIIVSGGIISGLYPIAIGAYIEKNPFVIMYTNYFSIIVASIAFFTIYCITTRNISNSNDYTVTTEKKIDPEIMGEIPLKSNR